MGEKRLFSCGVYDVGVCSVDMLTVTYCEHGLDVPGVACSMNGVSSAVKNVKLSCYMSLNCFMDITNLLTI
jgi:hypothetical protein